MPDTGLAKNRRWLWTAVALGILLGVAVMLRPIGRLIEHETPRDVNDLAGGNAATDPNAPVRDYLEFARTGGDQPTGFDPSYLANGLRKMAAALATLNVGDLDLHVTLRAAAEHVLLSPGSTTTTGTVRSGLIAAAIAIEETGQRDLEDLSRTAESVRRDTPLAEQRETVREFFVQSADALGRLSSSP